MNWKDDSQLRLFLCARLPPRLDAAAEQTMHFVERRRPARGQAAQRLACVGKCGGAAVISRFQRISLPFRADDPALLLQCRTQLLVKLRPHQLAQDRHFDLEALLIALARVVQLVGLDFALTAALLLAPGWLCFLYHLRLPGGYEFVWRYLYLPLVLLTVLSLSWLDSRVRVQWLRRALVLLGDYSLEFYLIYENLYLFLCGVFKSADTVGLSYALPCFVAALLLSLALKRAVAVLTKALRGEESA